MEPRKRHKNGKKKEGRKVMFKKIKTKRQFFVTQVIERVLGD